MADTVLTINNINKSYGDNLILNGLSLDVHKGEVIVIIGPSGCGKSTLLRCINALEPIQGGEIRLDGELIDGNSRNIAQIRQKIGMVFQNYELFPHKTVLQNIILAPMKVQKRSKDEVTEEAEQLLERVGLLDKKDSYPRQLSGGQKQRVAIVRALCMHPEIMLFDEVTAALDPEMVREVLDTMLELAKNGSTMLIVTHEMNFAREVASRVLFFADGGIYEQGTPAEIFDAPKREKTISFINKIKYFSYEITRRDFDLMQMQGGIQNFGEKYGLDQKHTYRLQICCEELIYELLDRCYPNRDDVDLELTVSHAEADGTTKIDLSCGGTAFNPFEQEEEVLGVTILKNMAQKLDYRHTDGRNQISIEL